MLVRAYPPVNSRMTCAMPRNWSGVRSPRGTFTSIVEKPSWRWGRTLAATKRSNSERSPLGEPGATGGGGALACSSSMNSSGSGVKSRSATQSPFISSSTISRKASMPILSIRNLIRARMRFARSSSWRSKIRRTASETFR